MREGDGMENWSSLVEAVGALGTVPVVLLGSVVGLYIMAKLYRKAPTRLFEFATVGLVGTLIVVCFVVIFGR